MHSQESSSFYYQEQFRKPSDEELFLALKEEIKNDKDALRNAVAKHGNQDGWKHDSQDRNQ